MPTCGASPCAASPGSASPTRPQPPADDATPDESYKLFWLRELAVRLRHDAGVLPGWRLAEYMLRSDTGPLYAVKEFRAAREWVRRNRYRYQIDPRDLVAGWERA